MEADLDIFFSDFEDIRSIGGAQFFYVSQHEDGPV
jgi:hypothetical protein